MKTSASPSGCAAARRDEFLGGEFPGGDAVKRRGAGEIFDLNGVGASAGNEGFAGREVFV